MHEIGSGMVENGQIHGAPQRRLQRVAKVEMKAFERARRVLLEEDRHVDVAPRTGIPSGNAAEEVHSGRSGRRAGEERLEGGHNSVAIGGGHDGIIRRGVPRV